MHQVKQQDGRVKMEEVKTFALKSGESLTLAPGGAHLMMFEPTRALTPGEKVTFTLDFGTAGKVTTQFPVQRQAPRGSAAPAHDHDHGEHGHHH
jgi:copper(I)-binding protein